MSTTLTVTGVRETADALNALAKTTEKSIIRKGLRAGAKVILPAARSDAPARTGRIRQNVKIRAGRGSKGIISLTVGVGAKDFKGETFYAGFVIFGFKKVPTFQGTGGRIYSRPRGSSPLTAVPGNNFLMRAYNSTAASAANVAVETIGQLVEAAAANKGNA